MVALSGAVEGAALGVPAANGLLSSTGTLGTGIGDELETVESSAAQGGSVLGQTGTQELEPVIVEGQIPPSGAEGQFNFASQPLGQANAATGPETNIGSNFSISNAGGGSGTIYLEDIPHLSDVQQLGVQLQQGWGAGMQELQSSGVALNMADSSASSGGLPAWLQRVQQGNAFNAEQATNYPYNEVYIENGGASSSGYYRLDSYNPTAEEIVSRKFTQFADIQESTGIGYVNEIPSKYSVGSTIANVPSNGDLGCDLLQGQYILEVPTQIRSIPQSVLDAANGAGVIIRDTNGWIYNPITK